MHGMFLLIFTYILPRDSLAKEIGQNTYFRFFETRRLVRIFPWNSSVAHNSSIHVELKNVRMLQSNIDILFPSKKVGGLSQKFARSYPV